MSISINPSQIDFGYVFRDTVDNSKEGADIAVSVISETNDYYLSIKGTDLEGQEEPAAAIPINNMKYEIDQSGNWETLSDVLTAVAHDSPTGPGGDDYNFDFTIDIPGDAYIQEYQGTIIFDVTTLAVTFDPDGNSTLAQSHSTTVKVYPPSGMDDLLYQWSTSALEGGLDENEWEGFISGQEITTPEGVTGDYYLWIMVIDNVSNEATFRSNVFRLDNTAPTGTITINSGANYATPFSTLTLGLSASDAHSGVSQMRFRNGDPADPESPDGWSEWEDYSATKNWNQYVYYDSDGGEVDDELLLPWITIPESGEYELNFMEYVDPVGSHDAHEIFVGTDDGAGGTDWESLEVMGSRNTGGWYFRRIDLSDYAGQEIRIAFRNQGASPADWEIDDIYVMNSIKGGTQTVQVQYMDGAGNISPVYSDTIKVHALYWYGAVEDWVEGYIDDVPDRQLDALDTDGVHKYLGAIPRLSEVTYVTNDMFDLTGVNNVNIEWKNTGYEGPQNRSRLIVSANKNANDNTAITALVEKTRPFALVTDSVDVSTLNTSYYIRVHARNNANANRPAEVHSYRVWFE